VLYVTTRDKNDAVTAYRTLSGSKSSDGGLYIPFQSIKFSHEQILELKDKSFGKCVAEILNFFFSARLDAWDVECCIGRRPANLVPMSHKIVICEIWNNPEWNFSRFVRNLHGRLSGSDDSNGNPTTWTWIVVRIAVLFGIYGELFRSGSVTLETPMDIAVSTGDFTGPMAVWYAREMGLPIGALCFSCEEHGELWNLFYRGQMQPSIVEQQYAVELERFIFNALGAQEALRYVQCCDEKKMYSIRPEQITTMRRGVFCTPVSYKRVLTLVRSIYRTNTYLLSPESALAFASLQDYRAKYSKIGPALLLSEKGPLTAIDTASEATGISVEELKRRIRTV
jgi:threonine synthase